jgi:thiol peroxidase
MVRVYMDEDEFELSGSPLKVGDRAPAFRLKEAGSLSEIIGNPPSKGAVALDDLGPFHKIINVVISMDTPLCAQSVRYFARVASVIQGVVPLVISSDLPFALGRQAQKGAFSGLTVLSAHATSFGADYGVLIDSGKLKGLMSRALWVLDPDNRVIHADLPENLLKEPDYRRAVRALIEDQVMRRKAASK